MPVTLPRWELVAIERDNHYVHVRDHLSKRPRSYFIPHVAKAVIIDHILDAETSHGKIMRINLLDGSRQFIC